MRATVLLLFSLLLLPNRGSAQAIQPPPTSVQSLVPTRLCSPFTAPSSGWVLTWNASLTCWNAAAATGGGGSGVWGSITGTLSSQTDLQTVLTGKESILTFSTGLLRSTNAITCVTATTSIFGCLTPTDFATFNNKQAALGFTAENAANKDAASGYAGLTAGGLLKIAEVPTGTSGSTVPFGNDSRFSDARTPTAHNLLSAAHGDTTTASAVRGGALFAIGASPLWTQVAHSSATGGYWKWNGTDVVASTGAAAGTGACTNGIVTTENADAAPTCTGADTTTTHALFATAGAPAFRALAAGDVPTLNQDTTGSAAKVNGAVVPVSAPFVGTNSSGQIVLASPFATNAQTATYQVLAGDFSAYKTIIVASGTFTITLVASGSQPPTGQKIEVLNYGSGVVTVARSGQNLNGGTGTLTVPAASATAPASATIVSNATDYFGWLAQVPNATGCTNQFVRTLNGPAAPTCASVANADITNSTIDLTTKVTGLLPAANIDSAIVRTIVSGSSSLGTSAIASAACATVVTTTATGAASTDGLVWQPSGSIKAITGYVAATTGGLSIAGYLTTNNVNWDVCNWTSSSITPGAVTLIWRVTR